MASVANQFRYGVANLLRIVDQDHAQHEESASGAGSARDYPVAPGSSRLLRSGMRWRTAPPGRPAAVVGSTPASFAANRPYCRPPWQHPSSAPPPPPWANPPDPESPREFELVSQVLGIGSSLAGKIVRRPQRDGGDCQSKPTVTAASARQSTRLSGMTQWHGTRGSRDISTGWARRKSPACLHASADWRTSTIDGPRMTSSGRLIATESGSWTTSAKPRSATALGKTPRPTSKEERAGAVNPGVRGEHRRPALMSATPQGRSFNEFPIG
jgi:hypothetical protein